MTGSAASGLWSPRPVEILVVEDVPADLRLLQIAIEAHGMHARLHAVPDGGQALGALRGELRPDLVLLDLKMPRDGRPGGAAGDEGR